MTPTLDPARPARTRGWRTDSPSYSGPYSTRRKDPRKDDPDLRIPKPGRSLEAKNPAAALMWDYEANGDLRPSSISAASTHPAWFRCGTGHVWHRPVARAPRRCPECGWIPEVRNPALADDVIEPADARILRARPGVNDLASQRPDIAAQWHPVKNQGLTPADVRVASTVVVWWRCAQHPDHEWRQQVATRTADPAAPCLICNGGTRTRDRRSLAVGRPDLAAEWHPTRNGSLTPEQVYVGGTRRVWWRCAVGHEWESTVKNRGEGYGCRECWVEGKKVDYDVAALHPELVAWWHPTRNGSRTLSDVSYRQEVWWRCAVGHEWKATARSMADRSHNCWACERSIATKRPDVASLWHPTRNGEKSPLNLGLTSRGTYWWLCLQGHVWQERITAITSRLPENLCRHSEHVGRAVGVWGTSGAERFVAAVDQQAAVHDEPSSTRPSGLERPDFSGDTFCASLRGQACPR